MTLKEKIKNFLKKKSDKTKIIVIYGPTASGKTGMSIDIAKEVDSEIISTDSRQIFRELNIGTGKITDDEKEGIKHHMLDIINPNQEYSVGEFKKEAEIKIEEIYAKGKIPILCGGTGLYIDSLIYDFNIPEVPADEKIRKKLEKEAEVYGNEYIWNKLNKLDPEYAKELHPNNTRYVIRALEVKILTGKSKLDFREEKKLKYDTLFLTPYNENRKYLYSRIDKRVKMMFEQGLVNEVEKLLEKYDENDFGMKTIGYSEVVSYLKGYGKEYFGDKKLSLGEKEKFGIRLSLEETIELVKKNNRNYAKKQLTWFKKYGQ